VFSHVAITIAELHNNTAFEAAYHNICNTLHLDRFAYYNLYTVFHLADRHTVCSTVHSGQSAFYTGDIVFAMGKRQGSLRLLLANLTDHH